jgi:simple sugar transport system ATP-binding protein
MKAGLAYVPEDRFGTALAPSLPGEDNLALTAFRDRPLSLGPFVRRQRIRDRARRLIERYRVRTPGPTTPARLLSGGNAQKVVVARVLTSEPRVVVASSPTRGLDVGATHAVRTLIAEAADAGVGVVLISEDLQEILSLSDRIGVMFRGRLVGMRDRGEADVEDLGMLMGGAALEGLQMELPLRDQLSSGAVSGGRASSTERGQ